MNWIRLVTGVQVLVDLPVAGMAPDGEGHTYHRQMVPMWQTVLGLDHPQWKPAGKNPYRDADAAWLNERMVRGIQTAIAKNVYQ